MTPQEIKDKVLAAWLKQTEKYAAGPKEHEIYCVSSHCYMCDISIGDGCGYCPHGYDRHCITQLTYKNLYNNLMYSLSNSSTKITPELTTAMSIRHKFYVRAYEEVLVYAPAERFLSGGFPELLKIDRELAEGIK